MIELSKSEEREARNLAGEAYKFELAREIEKLEVEISSWRKGDITVFDLDDRVHEYYSGPRKRLYEFYVMQRQPEVMVARAIALGLIERDRVSATVEKKIEHLIQFFKESR